MGAASSASRRSSAHGSPALRPRSASLRPPPPPGEELALGASASASLGGGGNVLGREGSGGSVGGASRDEAAYYQAESQSLLRENQMLRQRIRELGTWFLFRPWVVRAVAGTWRRQRGRDARFLHRCTDDGLERQATERAATPANAPATSSGLAGAPMEVEEPPAAGGEAMET